MRTIYLYGYLAYSFNSSHLCCLLHSCAIKKNHKIYLFTQLSLRTMFDRRLFKYFIFRTQCLQTKHWRSLVQRFVQRLNWVER